MKKEVTFKLILLGGILLCFTEGKAQEKIGLYSGEDIKVSSNEILSIQGEFVNTSKGGVTNQGDIYFGDDFTNDGYFIFSKSEKGSKVFFEQLDIAKKKIKLGGAKPSALEEVIFNTTEIDLQNEISIAAKAKFEHGNVVVNTPLSGAITFLEEAEIEDAGDTSHVVGWAERDGKKELEMPVGDGTYYRPIVLGESTGLKNLFQTQYKKVNPLIGREHKERNAIMEINNAEYWEVKNEATNGAIILTLSWDERTTPASLLKNPEKGLHILRWDAVSLKWEDEGGIVDVINKTVKTPMTVNASGIFTLGLVDADYNAEIKIYNALTPNGDGKNDYFIIENINKYPNSVQIVNRWGSKVFEADNYDPKGDGSINVFRGEAEGKGVSSRGKLPTGTYYYIVKYELRTAKGSEWVKKAGYLHLENN